MPSLTEYFGSTITNLGPLTTTYTAPASCATQADHLVIAIGNFTGLQLGRSTCGLKPFSKCFPSGTAYDEIISKYQEKPIQGYMYYFSPGLACPSAWTTAGTLAHGNKTGSADEGGVFTKDPFEYYDLVNTEAEPPDEWKNPKSNWLKVLDPSETLAYCCPSGYTADVWGDCSSSLDPISSYTGSEVCVEWYTGDAFVTVSSVEGSAVTRGVLSVIQATATYDAVTMGFSTGGEYELILASKVPAVPLVYQASDVATKTSGGDGKAGTEGDDEGDSEGDDKSEDNEDNESGASTIVSTHGGSLFLALGVALLVGAGLLTTW
ncbi:hypothetical protein FZEAL_6949 [Fusarium zealandicum]|uniref:Uncharacterized protein n=1 Tax=Fusarium zealandicum TaxID=1053134 RepID=A0A8H4XJ40_9HYPO|nr:hypothetical protein FZEAL_6949 [Fusarium zealandicum]